MARVCLGSCLFGLFHVFSFSPDFSLHDSSLIELKLETRPSNRHGIVAFHKYFQRSGYRGTFLDRRHGVISSALNGLCPLKNNPTPR